MVATLVRLRWRLSINQLSRNIWALIGTILAALYGLGLLAMLISGAVGLGYLDAHTIAVILGALGSGLLLGWMIFPLFLSGVDSTLDPRAMAAWTAPSRGLAIGMVAAGAVGIPGIVTGLATLLPALSWAVAGQWGAAVLAVVLAPVAWLTCVLLSRVVVVGLGVTFSRRGRDLMTVLALLVIFTVSVLPTVVQSISLDAAGLERILSYLRHLGLSPFGWAFAAPGYLAQGQALPAVGLAAAAVLFLLALLPLWERILTTVMTKPVQRVVKDRAYRESVSGSTASGPLAWHARFERVLPSPAAAVAARCLRYWHVDPRYLSSSVALLFLVGFTWFMMSSAGSVNIDADGGSARLQLAAWGQAPEYQLLIPAVFAMLAGWSLADDIAMDSTAFWQQLASGISGLHDRLGRLAASLVWQLPLLVAITLLFAGYTGAWSHLAAYVGLMLALYGVAHGWALFSSVVLPYQTKAPGESPWKSNTSGMAFLISLIQMLSWLGMVIICSPFIGALAWMAATGSWGWSPLMLVTGLAWCLGFMWLGVRVSATQLERRGPQLLATIRSWPGHEEIR